MGIRGQGEYQSVNFAGGDTNRETFAAGCDTRTTEVHDARGDIAVQVALEGFANGGRRPFEAAHLTYEGEDDGKGVFWSRLEGDMEDGRRVNDSMDLSERVDRYRRNGIS